MPNDKPTILVQLDTDPQPSVFDAVAAVDAGVDHLFRLGQVRPETVRDLVYGALFTRGLSELHRTALFIGGSNVALGEAVLEAVRDAFFSSFRLSVLLDANGSNTTAAAAVLAAVQGIGMQGGTAAGTPVAVLGAGPVGQRIARLLIRLGCVVSIGEPQLERARAAAERLEAVTGTAPLPFATGDAESLGAGLRDQVAVLAAGPAGVTVFPAGVRRSLPALKVLIDLNAVPPLGIEGVEMTDEAADRDGALAWGALGVGGTKMKIHRKAIQELFTTNNKVLDAEQVLELGRDLG